MEQLWARIEQSLVLSQMGTLCASCQARGVWTDHSPAGAQHQRWAAQWKQDPSWLPPDGIGRHSWTVSDG